MADVKARPAPEYLPKQGEEVDMEQNVTHRLLHYPQAWTRVIEVLGRDIEEAEVEQIRALYPDGIPEGVLSTLVEQLHPTSAQQRPQLRVVA